MSYTHKEHGTPSIKRMDEDYVLPQKIPMGKLTVFYVPEHEMEHDGQVFFRRPDGRGYNLRQFKDCKPSTITMVAFLNGEIYNFRHMAHVLPVARWVEGERTKNPVGTIVSVRIPPLIKEVDEPVVIGRPGGWFMNSIFVDVVVTGNKDKTISTKLTRQKIQMTGPKSEEMGVECVEYLMHAIKGAIKFIKKVNADLPTFWEAVEWLCQQSTEEVTTIQPCGEDMILYEDRPDLVYKREGLADPPPELAYMVEQLLFRTANINYISELRQRCLYLSKIEKLASSKLSVSKVTRSLVKFSHQLGFSVDRQYVAQQLCKRGFNAEFINTAQTFISIKIDTRIKTSNKSVTRRKKGSGDHQLLKLYAKGNLAHNGPGGAAMEDCYIRIMTNLICIVDKTRRRKEELENYKRLHGTADIAPTGAKFVLRRRE